MSRFQMMFPCEMVSRFQPHICMDREVDGLMDWLGGWVGWVGWYKRPGLQMIQGVKLRTLCMNTIEYMANIGQQL